MTAIPDRVMQEAHDVYKEAAQDGFRAGSIKIIARAILEAEERGRKEENDRLRRELVRVKADNRRLAGLAEAMIGDRKENGE